MGRKISRSYDMWGMGCIILEWIIWLVYGIRELDEFCQQAFPEEFDAFWLCDSEKRTTNPVVISWMKHMTDTCLADGDECYSVALRNLLIFVKDRLLVPDTTEQDTSDIYHPSADNEEVPVYITPSSDIGHTSPIPGRAKGKDACRELETISFDSDRVPIYFTPAPSVTQLSLMLGRAKAREAVIELDRISSVPHGDSYYMHNPNVKMRGPNSRGPPRLSKLLAPSQAFNSRLEVYGSLKPRQSISRSLMRNRKQNKVDLIYPYPQRQRFIEIRDIKTPEAIRGSLNVWITSFDNLFAKAVFGNLDDHERSALAPVYPIKSPLCLQCSDIETGIFSRGLFSTSYEKAQTSQTTCCLCAIIYEEMNSTAEDNSYKTMLREGSSLITERGEPPSFSLVVGPSAVSDNLPPLRENY